MLQNIKFNENGLIPAIIQDINTKEVLMMAYMNEEAFEKTLETKRTWFYSRSRKQLWNKGETSGNYQEVKEIWYDCDQDTLLVEVVPAGNACHTGAVSCFYRSIYKEEKRIETSKDIIQQLYQRIVDRKMNPKEGAYTTYLFNKGIDKILKKIGEEAAEVIIAAKNTDKSESVYEISDLLYHTLVLMVDKGISIEDIKGELFNRYSK